jgi:hypothetical protein
VIRVEPLRAVVALMYMAGVVWLSSRPGRDLVSWGFSSFLLNLGHVPLFAGLALVTLWAVVGPAPWVRLALVGALCMIFAATDEWHQQYVPGRVASLEDLRSDALGIAIGLGLAQVWRIVRMVRRGESKA